jgi:hypothetical protein
MPKITVVISKLDLLKEMKEVLGFNQRSRVFNNMSEFNEFKRKIDEHGLILKIDKSGKGHFSKLTENNKIDSNSNLILRLEKNENKALASAIASERASKPEEKMKRSNNVFTFNNTSAVSNRSVRSNLYSNLNSFKSILASQGFIDIDIETEVLKSRRYVCDVDFTKLIVGSSHIVRDDLKCIFDTGNAYKTLVDITVVETLGLPIFNVKANKRQIRLYNELMELIGKEQIISIAKQSQKKVGLQNFRSVAKYTLASLNAQEYPDTDLIVLINGLKSNAVPLMESMRLQHISELYSLCNISGAKGIGSLANDPYYLETLIPFYIPFSENSEQEKYYTYAFIVPEDTCGGCDILFSNELISSLDGKGIVISKHPIFKAKHNKVKILKEEIADLSVDIHIKTIKALSASIVSEESSLLIQNISSLKTILESKKSELKDEYSTRVEPMPFVSLLPKYVNEDEEEYNLVASPRGAHIRKKKSNSA